LRQTQLFDIASEAVCSSQTGIRVQRGDFRLDTDGASQIPAIAEPFFMWRNADVSRAPAMRPEDPGRAGPATAAAVQKRSPTREDTVLQQTARRAARRDSVHLHFRHSPPMVEP
jgi:hypothetical protein